MVKRAQTEWQRGTTFQLALQVDQVADGFTVDENTDVTFVGKCVTDPEVELDFIEATVDFTFTKTYQAAVGDTKARLIATGASTAEPPYGWMLVGARFDFGSDVIKHSKTQIAVKVVRKM